MWGDRTARRAPVGTARVFLSAFLVLVAFDAAAEESGLSPQEQSDMLESVRSQGIDAGRTMANAFNASQKPPEPEPESKPAAEVPPPEIRRDAGDGAAPVERPPEPPRPDVGSDRTAPDPREPSDQTRPPKPIGLDAIDDFREDPISREVTRRAEPPAAVAPSGHFPAAGEAEGRTVPTTRRPPSPRADREREALLERGEALARSDKPARAAQLLDVIRRMEASLPPGINAAPAPAAPAEPAGAPLPTRAQRDLPPLLDLDGAAAQSPGWTTPGAIASLGVVAAPLTTTTGSPGSANAPALEMPGLPLVGAADKNRIDGGGSGLPGTPSVASPGTLPPVEALPQLLGATGFPKGAKGASEATLASAPRMLQTMERASKPLAQRMLAVLARLRAKLGVPSAVAANRAPASAETATAFPRPSLIASLFSPVAPGEDGGNEDSTLALALLLILSFLLGGISLAISRLRRHRRQKLGEG